MLKLLKANTALGMALACRSNAQLRDQKPHLQRSAELSTFEGKMAYLAVEALGSVCGIEASDHAAVDNAEQAYH